MSRKVVAVSLLGLLLGLGLLAGPTPAPSVQGPRVVFLAAGLADVELTACAAAVAAANPSAVLLADGPEAAEANRAFLAAYKPSAVIPVGPFQSGDGLEKKFGFPTAVPLYWQQGPDDATRQALFPTADSVVLCPADQRRCAAHAACLAGAIKAPLLLTRRRGPRAARVGVEGEDRVRPRRGGRAAPGSTACAW